MLHKQLLFLQLKIIVHTKMLAGFECICILSGIITVGAEWIPTLSKPFIFFHIEKTGGNDLKKQFFKTIYSPNSNRESIISGRNVIGKTSEQHLASAELLNRTACSVAFLGHFRPSATLAVLWAIDQGFFGPVACHRGWPVWEDMRIRPLNSLTSAPYIRITEFKLLLRLIYCTIIFREPISQRWSHYYYFDYPKSKRQFEDVITENSLGGKKTFYFGDITTNHIYSGLFPQSKTRDQFKLQVPLAILYKCHIGIQEAYESYYNELRNFFPRLPGTENLRTSRTSSKQAGVPKPETLPAVIRSHLAGNATMDGRLWALARQNTESNWNRDPGKECDLVCWDTDGSWWLPPQPSVQGTCKPCSESSPTLNKEQ